MRRRGRKAKCPYCNGHRTIGKGVRRTVTLGDRPLRICRDCGRKFTVRRSVAVSDVGRASAAPDTP